MIHLVSLRVADQCLVETDKIPNLLRATKDQKFQRTIIASVLNEHSILKKILSCFEKSGILVSDFYQGSNT